MPKKNVTIVKPQDNVLINPPDFIEQGVGLEGIGEYVVPPRLKIVQKQADEVLLEKFSVGDMISVPDMVPLYEPSRDDRGRLIEEEITGLRFTPIFFFPEWVIWNPFELKGTLPATAGRTLDPSNPIAVKARNSSLRSEPCPGSEGLMIRYCEHLNFIVALQNHPYKSHIVLSFSRAEHFAGRQFCNLLKMRKAAIFGNVFEMRLNHRSNAQGDWWGLDIVNPEADPWVDQEEYTRFSEAHNELNTLKDSIKVNYEDEAVATEAETDF